MHCAINWLLIYDKRMTYTSDLDVIEECRPLGHSHQECQRIIECMSRAAGRGWVGTFLDADFKGWDFMPIGG